MMERLTEKHYKSNDGYYMKCSEFCEKEDVICEDCNNSQEIIDRLGAIEDILGDEYDLDRLETIMSQRMTMREEVAEKMKLVGSIPIDRLREIVEAEKRKKG